MSIKKFIISSGDGDLEESELDSSGVRTIGYDDVSQRVQLSNAYVIGNLYISGSIYGNLTGSLSGSSTGGSSNSSGISSVSSSGNITGSGLSGDEIRLKDNISLTSVTASFSGDGSRLTNVSAFPTVKFTKASGSISVGDAVALSSTGLSRCNNTSNTLSNVIGIVVSSGSDGVYVQTSGEATPKSLFFDTLTTGTVFWAYTGGNLCTYSYLVAGNYATQVGYLSNDSKIIIQPRVFGQLA